MDFTRAKPIGRDIQAEYSQLQMCGGYDHNFILDKEQMCIRDSIYTDLIRKKKPLSEIDFDLIRESPQLMAFSQKDRRVQLLSLIHI